MQASGESGHRAGQGRRERLRRIPNDVAAARRRFGRLGGAPGPVLMYGAKPAWRALRQGISDGADVRQLEANLRALGYDPGHAMRVDGHYDFATRAIVERWQRAAGLALTGEVGLGQVAFLPGPRRIGKLEVAEGAPVAAGAPVVTTTAVRRTVMVELATDKQSYVA